MIIKSKMGDTLELTPYRLTEVRGYESSNPFFTTKAELAKALKGQGKYFSSGDIKVASVEWSRYDGVYVLFDADEGRIGCKTFTKCTFNKILRTMGLKRN